MATQAREAREARGSARVPALGITRRPFPLPPASFIPQARWLPPMAALMPYAQATLARQRTRCLR